MCSAVRPAVRLVALASIGVAAVILFGQNGDLNERGADTSTVISPSTRASVPGRSLELASAVMPSAGARLSTDSSTAPSNLCLLRQGAHSTTLVAFLNRYSYFALTLGDAEEILNNLRNLNEQHRLLPAYDVLAQSELPPPVPSGDSQRYQVSAVAGLSTEQVGASQRLSQTYLPTSESFYDYSRESFDQAIENLATSFSQGDLTSKRAGLLLLYRHARAAGQHYWRHQVSPDWQDFVHFEQYRQALIYLIQVYGTEESIQEVAGDRFLLPPVNKHSGQPSRAYGDIFAPPVEAKKTQLISYFRLSEEVRTSGVEPVNFAGDEQMVSYQQANSARIDEIARSAWGDLSNIRLGQLLAAISKECN